MFTPDMIGKIVRIDIVGPEGAGYTVGRLVGYGESAVRIGWQFEYADDSYADRDTYTVTVEVCP